MQSSRGNGETRRLQIKGRCLLPGCKPGQRLGSIDLKKDWDAVLMVLLDKNFEATGNLRSRPRAGSQSARRARIKSPQRTRSARRKQIQIHSNIALGASFIVLCRP